MPKASCRDCPPSLLLQPSAVVAHEVSKPPGVRVPSMLDECRKACGNRFGQLHFAKAREQACEQQRARVVVGTVAMGAIRYGMDGVLEHARAVAEREEMPDLNFRYDVSVSSGDDRINGNRYSRPGILALSLEDARDSAWRFAPRSSIGLPHRHVCAWHVGARRSSANRRSRYSKLWRPKKELEYRTRRLAAPRRASRVSIRLPFPIQSCKPACPMSSGLY